jgi:hypothetical protein
VQRADRAGAVMDLDFNRPEVLAELQAAFARY